MHTLDDGIHLFWLMAVLLTWEEHPVRLPVEVYRHASLNSDETCLITVAGAVAKAKPWLDAYNLVYIPKAISLKKSFSSFLPIRTSYNPEEANRIILAELLYGIAMISLRLIRA